MTAAWKTRNPKRKTYTTQRGTRVFFEGAAFAALPAPGRWVTAKAESAEEARIKAVLKAVEVEEEHRRAQIEAERTKNEAEHAEVLAAIQAARPAAPTCEVETVVELLLEYNEHCREIDRADTTLDKYAEHVARFGGLVVEGEPRPLSEWRLADLRGKGFKRIQKAVATDLRTSAPNTVRARFSYLSSALNYAVRVEYLAANPMGNVDLPPREEKGELEVTVEQVAAMMDASRDDPSMRSGIAAAFAYGCRRQEIVAITEDDVQGGKLVVSRQLARVCWDGRDGPRDAPVPTNARYGRTDIGRTLVLKKTKSTRKKVTYELTPEIEALFKESLSTAKPTVIWDAVDRRWREVRFVVHAPTGSAQEGQHFRDRYSAMCDRHGVGGVLHDLRALFASDAVANQIDTKIVSQLLRHCDLATTERYLRGLGRQVSEASAILANRAGVSLRIGGASAQASDPTSEALSMPEAASVPTHFPPADAAREGHSFKASPSLPPVQSGPCHGNRRSRERRSGDKRPRGAPRK